MNEWSGVESKAPLDDIKNILSRTTKQSSHNIATSVMAANMYKNPAQATAETLRLLDKKGFESVLFSMDTEWVGGGNSGMLATPVELGINPMMLKDGQLSLVKDAAGNEIKLGFAVQLEDSSAKRLKELIVELKNGTKNPLTLTDDEYRSLKDLINYSGNVIEDGGVLNRSAAKATLSRTNIMRNIDLIKSGLDNLDPGNKASKAIKRNELHSVISEKIMSYGFKIEEMNPIIAMHNGINADLPVWQESFQKEIHEIFGFKNKARILDTYSWMKSVYPSVLGAYYGSEGRIKSPSGLEMMSKLLGVPQIAHQASEDAYAGAKLTMQLWGFDKGRKIPMSDTIFTKGSMLFSTNGMYRGEDNPLDYILENDKRNE
jgi:hypothetical protein